MLGGSSSIGLSQQHLRRTPRMPIIAGENLTTNHSLNDNDSNDVDDVDVESGLIHQQSPPPPESHLRHTVLSFIYILGWYLFSVSISVYNKWMFSPDHLDFRFPIFSTAIHQLIQTSLAASILFVVPEFKPQASFKNFNDYFKRIGPCALASAGDIGMGNVSLRFVTLSFYTMVKSSSLGFVLLFGVFFKLEKPTMRLCLIIVFMSIGVLMMVAGETQFQFFGFLLVMGAAACSGLRWSLTQLLLRSGDNRSVEKDKAGSLSIVSSSSASSSTGLLSNDEDPIISTITSTQPLPSPPPSSPSPSTSSSVKPTATTATHSTHSTHNNPIYTILSLSPIMAAILFTMSLLVEGPHRILSAKLWEEKGYLAGLGLLIFPGILAFCMTLSEFLLLNRTSVLTLAIAGICKEVVTICVACIFFGDRLTFVNGLGLFVTTACIGAYNIHRYKESKLHLHRKHKYYEDDTE